MAYALILLPLIVVWYQPPCSPSMRGHGPLQSATELVLSVVTGRQKNEVPLQPVLMTLETSCTWLVPAYQMLCSIMWEVSSSRTWQKMLWVAINKNNATTTTSSPISYATSKKEVIVEVGWFTSDKKVLEGLSSISKPVKVQMKICKHHTGEERPAEKQVDPIVWYNRVHCIWLSRSKHKILIFLTAPFKRA